MKQHGEVGGDAEEEEEESADNRGFTGAPWANPVPGGGYQGARNSTRGCVTKNPLGRICLPCPGPQGRRSRLSSFAAFGHGLTRRAQIETEIIK